MDGGNPRNLIATESNSRPTFVCQESSIALQHKDGWATLTPFSSGRQAPDYSHIVVYNVRPTMQICRSMDYLFTRFPFTLCSSLLPLPCCGVLGVLSFTAVPCCGARRGMYGGRNGDAKGRRCSLPSPLGTSLPLSLPSCKATRAGDLGPLKVASNPNVRF